MLKTWSFIRTNKRQTFKVSGLYLHSLNYDVISGGDNDGDGDEVTAPTTFDYVMHFLTVFWKVG